jgi:hypothetical protein
LVALFAIAQGAMVRVKLAGRLYGYGGFDAETMTHKGC